MKQEMKQVPLSGNIRPRNSSSDKKKLIDYIMKEKDKKLLLYGNKKKKQLVGYSNGEWTLRQLKLYHRYLSTHKNQFTDPQLRKRNKVFIKLADFIGSRTPDQCRSHHQKATCKFPDFGLLLSHYENKITHLTRMYEESMNPMIKEDEKNQIKKTGWKENQFQNRGGIIQEEKARVELQKEPKLQQNAQLQISNRNIQYNKLDKPTSEVISTNYYRLQLDGKKNSFRIEIDEGVMQIFQ